MGSGHIADVMRITEEVLHKIRRDADDRPEGSPLEVDAWVHLGYLLLGDVDDRKIPRPPMCVGSPLFLSFLFVV